MVRRKIVPLIAGVALALPVTLLSAFRPAPTLAYTVPGSPVAAARASTPEVLVEWVIRVDDLVACRTAAPDMRRMQHQYPSRVRFVAYAVETDAELVRSFLRRERLGHVSVQPITEREFQLTFAPHLGRGRTPSLLVSTGGTRVVFDAGTRGAPGRRGVDEFSAYLGTLLRPATVAGIYRDPSASRGQ